MASRAHRKGFKPLPSEGWSEEWGTWENYMNQCVHEGARVGSDGSCDYIMWITANGNFHREDGPAIEYTDGHRAWYVNGNLHRLDGPAFEHPDGSVEFYKDGFQYTDITFTQCVDDE